MLRKLSMAAILTGAVGVPYAMWKGDSAMDFAGSWLGASEEEASEADGARSQMTPTAYSTADQSYAHASTQFYDPTAYGPGGIVNNDPTSANQNAAWQATTTVLAEVLRMNITHQEITRRWPRVTTTLADTTYSGLRVPLVSGTAASDVTGSLTYYFDRHQDVQRITLHGTTGDPRALTSLLTGRMEFSQEDCLGGELYERDYLGQTTSVCRIRPANVLHVGATNSRYEILLELNREQWRSNLSAAAEQLAE